MGEPFSYEDYEKRVLAIRGMLKERNLSQSEMYSLFSEAMSKCEAMLKFLSDQKRKATDISV